ncbi:putative ribonuclease H-like domain-containing protein [Tanacetum coccineum]
MKKMYCRVVIDDFSRFSWVFFLATKDETSGILKPFITGIENQINHRVKIIRCDNGTEFKNKEMNQFCEMKGIKREFSVARTPQQNGGFTKHNADFHQIVDFLEASPLRYALLVRPTIYVSHIRQFWSTARIETTNEETQIIAKINGKQRIVSESSIRKKLKLKDKEWISNLPDTDLFENLSRMGYNISPNQRNIDLFDSMIVPQGEGSVNPTEPHPTPSPQHESSPQQTQSSPPHELIPTHQET